jgi:ATP-binding cassette, subfamily B, bacterial
MRLADATGGELLMNDINVKEYDPSTLRQHIAVLFQDIGKYWGITLHENIHVGHISNNNDGAIHQAAVDAGAAEFIESLPYKYDSFVGHMPGSRTRSFGIGRWDDDSSDSENESEAKKELEKRVKSNISGGQWQKIALARAFMRDSEADLLVLDEPTANLDPEAEYKLFETIRRLRKGRTTLYISHRFNTVRAADRIMVLEKGQVAEFGTHDDLMKLEDGKYRRLYSLQAKGFQFDEEGAVSQDVDGIKVDVKEDVVKRLVEAQAICNGLPN